MCYICVPNVLKIFSLDQKMADISKKKASFFEFFVDFFWFYADNM